MPICAVSQVVGKHLSCSSRQSQSEKRRGSAVYRFVGMSLPDDGPSRHMGETVCQPAAASFASCAVRVSER